MISFYPGPSKVYSKIPAYVKKAYDEGILSVNHRSEEFMALATETIANLKEKLNIPEDFTVFFTSSATECWEIIAQSLIDSTSFHFFNGAFGEKWFEYSKKLNPLSIGYRFNLEAELKMADMDFSSDDGVICITQNETSNGTQVSNKRIAKIRKRCPDHIIAVDATSSMGGINLKFENADVWFASVQKCFGLPAGMGIMICSPRAIAKAKQIDENDHYNSLAFMLEKIKVNQTTYTPNVLSIYLLNEVMKASKPIEQKHTKLKNRLKKFQKRIVETEGLELLIKNKKVQSLTVVPVFGSSSTISAFKSLAKDNGYLLGNGYGDLKEVTFRVANFPAIKNKELRELGQFLTQCKVSS